MERARLEDLSFLLYLKNKVLLNNFVEQRVNEEVSLTASNTYQITVPSDFTPNPFSRGRGIVYYDEVNVSGYGPVPDESQEQQNRVVVYDSSNVVQSPSSYTVNYEKGQILNPVGFTPDTVTYFYNYVSVLESEVDPGEPERKLDLPCVVVSPEGQLRKTGLQLGGGKIVPRKVNLYVYATSQAERYDLVQVLMNGLEDRAITVFDYNQSNGLPINYDGTYNSSFSPTALTEVSGCMTFDNVSYRHLRGTKDYTYPERYRSVISLNLVTYVEQVNSL